MDQDSEGGCLVFRELGEDRWQCADAPHSVGNTRGRIDPCVPVAECAIDDRKTEDDWADCSPVSPPQVIPGCGRSWVALNLVDAPADHASIRTQRVEQPNENGGIHYRPRDV